MSTLKLRAAQLPKRRPSQRPDLDTPPPNFDAAKYRIIGLHVFGVVVPDPRVYVGDRDDRPAFFEMLAAE